MFAILQSMWADTEIFFWENVIDKLDLQFQLVLMEMAKYDLIQTTLFYHIYTHLTWNCRARDRTTNLPSGRRPLYHLTAIPRSGSSPGCRETEVFRTFCRILGCRSEACLIQSHCFALAQGQRESSGQKMDNRQIPNQVSLVPPPPPSCLMKKLNVLEVKWLLAFKSLSPPSGLSGAYENVHLSLCSNSRLDFFVDEV